MRSGGIRSTHSSNVNRRNGRDLGARAQVSVLQAQECVCYALNMYQTGANLFFTALLILSLDQETIYGLNKKLIKFSVLVEKNANKV